MQSFSLRKKLKKEAQAREEERREKEEAKVREKETKRKLTKKMIKYGELIEEIIKETGLTESEIKKILEQ